MGSAFSAGIFLGVFRGVVLRGVKRGGNPESLADLRRGVPCLRGVDMVVTSCDEDFGPSLNAESGTKPSPMIQCSRGTSEGGADCYRL
jgi:hypothetical protein